MSHTLNIEKKSEIGMLFVVLIWGLGFPITRFAIVEMGLSPHIINTGRFIIGSIVLSAIFYKKIFRIDKVTLVTGTITGVFMYLAFFYQTLGAASTTAAKNAFLTQICIVITPILSYFLFRTIIGVRLIIAVLLALFGVFVLSYSEGEFGSFTKGDYYTLLCAVFFSFHMVLTSFYQKKYDLDPVLFNIVSMYTVAIIGLAITLTKNIEVNISANSMLPLIFLGLFNTGLCFTLQSIALKYSNATKISIIVALEAVIGAIGGAIFLSEPLKINIVLGGIMIVMAILITEIDIKKILKK